MPDVRLRLPPLNPKQQLAFDSRARKLLYGGATRGGKSFLVRWSYIVWCSQIPGLQTDIFRLNYDDVIANHMEGETSFPVLLSPWEKAGLCKITKTQIEFWNDSRITLKHCADDAVMAKHQGVPAHVRTWEEATQIAWHRMEWLNKWVTMSELMKERIPEAWKGLFPKIFYTTNPVGPSAPQLRRMFVENKKPMELYDHKGTTIQYIPALVEDNPCEDAEATRQRFSEGDERLADAMLNANWDALSGDYFPEWNEDRHVVPDFVPPYWWFRYRTIDLGYAEPTAVYFWAVSDGEVFRDSQGRQRWFPRGALIAYNEWYLCNERDPALGVRWRNEDIAYGILDRSEPEHKHVPTLSDSLPFQDRGGESAHMAFARCGCPLTLGDVSRVIGWNQLRARLIGVKLSSEDKERVAMIFFCERCKYARDYIPALPRHKSETKKEDAAEHGEATHAPDAIRIACMAHTVIKDKLEPVQSRIERELKAQEPTMKNITRAMGEAYFR